ncbi:SusC/RagA family TonB-linked outer membrane protein [Arcticibacter eurypsychrophilus]|uniref:SusC/RagA family TonB-linked outer membrane protein n=1 Tax=Arcticibacter eurypsychrophilus TaxID=1434752 RepID=UPI00084D6353|nr:TonB-dependent receptor [Arcticibacter eurypsychrophilus]
MKKHYMLLMLFFVVLSSWSYAQTGSISGQVLDETNQPLPGASISITSLNRATSTDGNGQFKLNAIPTGTYSISASFIGFEILKRNVTVVSGDTKVNVKLTPLAQNLTEVVVIGYGTQQKKDVTGSIATVGVKDFQKGTITSPDQLIVGKIAGVQVTTNGGAPGSGSTIRIRGGASLNASNDPLIVVDGVPLSGSTIPGVSNALAMINPNDIETFTVLKDANATAIYGSRASNGVVLITTKKGKSGAPIINFSTQNSVATVAKKVDVLSADQMRTYVNENGNAAQVAMVGTANTDWQDEIYRKAFTTDNNFSVAGSTKDMPYRVSFGYLNQNGTLLTDNLKRTSAAVSLNPKFFDNHLKVDLNLKGSLSKSQFANQDAIVNAIQFDPTQSVTAENPFDNYFEWTTGSGTTLVPNPNAPRNPVSLIKNKDDDGNTKRSFGNVQFDYSFHFLPELHANLNLGYDVSRGKGATFIFANAAQSYSTQGSYHKYQSDISNQVAEFYLNYNKDIKAIKSSISATAGYGYYANKTKNLNFSTYRADSTTVISTPTFPYDQPENRLLSYYGRLIYTYNDKYTVSGTVRTDGSSRFSEENRWGVFPSAAFTWRINQENFLKGTTVLSDLKLRLSYGVTGQQEGIANYSYLPNYSTSVNEAMYQIGDTFYSMNAPIAYDKNIKWETTTTINGGLDYGFLNGRINGSLDIYKKKTKDLLSSIPIPIGSNFSNFLLTNVGNMEASGVEFAINGKPILKNDFSWDLGFNVTYNKTKVTNLTASYDPSYQISTGGIKGATGYYIQAHTLNAAPNTFFVYKQVYGDDGKPLQGVYADLNGDGVINESGDRYFYKSPAPKITLGFSTSVNYKQWALSTVLRANLGNYVYNNVASSFTSRASLLNSGAGILNNVPTSFFDTQFINNQLTTDFYVQNASFMKMDNIGLSYNAGKILHDHTMGNLTISANVQNVFTITNYTGIDPEVYSGIDYQLYPRPRTFVLGLNLGF